MEKTCISCHGGDFDMHIPGYHRARVYAVHVQ